jgi:hypothetical protein
MLVLIGALIIVFGKRSKRSPREDLPLFGINGAFGEADWTPIRYEDPAEQRPLVARFGGVDIRVVIWANRRSLTNLSLWGTKQALRSGRQQE